MNVVVPAKVTVVPARSLERSRVVFPGTTMLSRTMEEHEAMALAMSEKVVTQHADFVAFLALTKLTAVAVRARSKRVRK